MKWVRSKKIANKRVLLVEDCPDQQRLMAHLLEVGGAKVTLECNGKAAVDRVLEDPQAFDVIIMDFYMPLTDGMQATKMLRDAGVTTPIVAVTSHHSDHLKQMWHMFGCSAYLEKPVSPVMVNEAFAEVLN